MDYNLESSSCISEEWAVIGLLSLSSDLERHFNVKLMISMQIYLYKAAAEMGRTQQQMMRPVSLS